MVSVHSCTVVIERDISCEFRKNNFRIDCTSICVSVIVKKLGLILDINLTILNNAIALIIDRSSSSIAKDIIARGWVIALSLIVLEASVRNRQIMRIIDEYCPTSDSSAICKYWFANQIFTIFVWDFLRYLCLLNKDSSSLSTLDVCKLWF